MKIVDTNYSRNLVKVAKTTKIFKSRVPVVRKINLSTTRLFSRFILPLLLFSFISSSLYAQIPTNGLVAYYPFNGNASDESGNGNNGTNNGATLAIDRFGNAGKAYSFNGTQYISVPYNSLLFPDELSVSLWINSSNISTHQIAIATGGLDAADTYTGFGFNSASGDSLYWADYDHSSSSAIAWIHQDLRSIGTNKWFFVTITRTTTTARLFINGVLTKELSGLHTYSKPTHTPMILGANRDGNDGHLGSLDDIRIYNRALSASEIQALYIEGIPTITSFTPTSGPIGTPVTITGTNFNTTTSNKVVYFGAVKAQVNAAASTSLSVTVPVGASYAPISVTDTTTRLTVNSAKPFHVTYSSNGVIDAGSFAAKVDFATGIYPHEVIIGDLDGDNKPDVGVTNSNNGNGTTVSIFRNLATSGQISSSSFSTKTDYTVGTFPIGMVFCDIDGDGRIDPVIANYGIAFTVSTVSCLRNIGASGTIALETKVDFPTGVNPSHCTTADFDNDGKMDIAEVNINGNTVSILRNTSGSGSFTSATFASKYDIATGSNPNGIAVADIDGDGKVDLIVSPQTDGMITVFRNSSTPGSLSFAAGVNKTTGDTPLSLSVADIDGDGKLDIIADNQNSNTVIVPNTSTSGIISLGTVVSTNVSGANHVAVTDIDGDGKPDIILTTPLSGTYPTSVAVVKNNSTSGSFILAAPVYFTVGSNPAGLAVGDVDGDGKPDILVANGNSNTLSVLRNTVAVNVAPSSPRNLTATAGNGQVTLKWSKNTEADFLNYRIYVGSDSNTVTLKDSSSGGINDTVRSIAQLLNGTKYYFRISAVDSARLESGQSIAVLGIPNASIVPAGLVVWYPFNGTPNDSSGNGNNGTNNGAMLTTDRFGNTGKAYSFDGVSSFIGQGNSSSLDNIVDEISVNYWVKKNLINLFGLVLAKRGNNTNLTSDIHFESNINTNTSNISFIYSGVGAPSPYYEVSTTRANTAIILNDGSWHQITMTHKYGGRLKSKIYIDGVSYLIDSSGLFSSNFPYPASVNASNLFIGKQSVSSSPVFYNGFLDDIRIYNRVLTQSEINQLYTEGGWIGNTAPKTPTNLTAVAGNTQVLLRWSKNTEIDFLKYRIYMGSDSTTLSLKDSTTVSILDTTKIITGLTNNQKYFFRITALDSARLESGQSFAVSTKPFDLVAWYKFDGNTADSSGNGNNGTNNGAAPTTDRFGIANNAYQFNGTSSYIDIGNLGGINDITCSIWMKVQSSSATGSLFGVYPSSNIVFSLCFNNVPGGYAANTIAYLISTMTANGRWGYGNSAIFDTLWHHIVFTRTNSTVGMYIDGSSVPIVQTNSQGNPNGVINPGINMYIGATAGTPVPLASFFFNGSLDDARIYNRIITQAEVTTLYREGAWIGNTAPTNPKNLTATAGNGQVTLKWSKNTEADFLKYRIYRGIDSTSLSLIDSSSASISDTTKIITGLTNGTKYYFRVSALDSARLESGKSSAVSATPLPPFTQISAGLTGVGNYSYGTWGDFDGDGDLDVAIAGQLYSSTTNVTKIYRNDGNGIFTDIGANLPGVFMGNLSWVDYDSDGDLDLLISGMISNSSTFTTRLYRNDAGTFVNANANLPDVYFSSSAWGDYDNDGDWDLLLVGVVSESPITLITKVFRNDGNAIFTDIGANLVHVYGNSSNVCAWGDYDNDGDLDILLCSNDASGNRYSKVYRNDDNNIFTDIAAPLTGVSGGSVAWGDYDNDGDLDILMMGSTGTSNQGYPSITKVYRNDSGSFIDIGASLSGLGGQGAAVAWGDIDNDGDLDIVISGFNGSTSLTKLYRNDNGVFVEISNTFDGVYVGTSEWGDYDSDGDVDLLLVGTKFGSTYISSIYRNNITVVNTSPTVPNGLSKTVSGSSVTLNWGKSSDSQTPQNGLSYNLRIGTSLNGSQILSPMANITNGYRLVPRLGNINQRTSWNIKNLNPGKYYWSVQAIDNAFIGSAFSAVDSFIVTGNTPPLTPQNLTATAGNGQVTLKWNKTIEADFLKYRIYMGSDSLSLNLKDSTSASISDTTKTITDLSNGTKYYFRVSALDSARLESGKSVAISVTPSPAIKIIGEYAADVNTVLLLHMNETSGLTVIDASSNSNNGTVTGTSVIEGRFGKARYFGGGANYIEVPNSATIDFSSSDFTCEMWLNVATATNRTFFSKHGGEGYMFYCDYSGRVYAQINGTTGMLQLSSNTSVTDGNWHHISAVRTLSGGKLYVDGILVSNLAANLSNASNTQSLTFGSLPYNQGFLGVIDEVRISNIARSPQEFNLQLPPKNLMVSVSGTNATLNWQNGGGAVPLMRYKIYRGADSTSINLIDSTAQLLYANNGLTQGTYYYRVSAVDSTGFEGAKSFAVKATISGVSLPPTITSFTPTRNTLNVAKNATISITFDQNMDQTSISSSTVCINGSQSGRHLHTQSYNSSNKTVTLYPDVQFKVGEVVTVTATRGIKSSSGDSLANALTWSFTIKTNTASGIFTQTSTPGVGNDPQSVVAGDFDRDGDIDLAVANNTSNTVSILLNNGSVTFIQSSTPAVGYTPNSITAGDFDGDGDIDLAVVNYVSGTVSILLNNGSGIFTKSSTVSVGSDPKSVTAGDFDGDGDIDLAVANNTSNTVSILLNNGSGTFIQSSTPALGNNPQSVTAGDLDGDGDIDLAVANSNSNTVSILLNNGSATFTQSSTTSVGPVPWSITSGDFNGDGYLDLAVTNDGNPNTVSILLNNGNGTFTLSSSLSVGGTPRSITASDLDGDGDIDLAVACNYGSNIAAIFINNGSGTFTQSFRPGVGGSTPCSITAADFDGNGTIDLASVNSISNTVSILMNTISGNNTAPSAPQNLVATASNAQVTLKWNKNTESDFLRYRIYGSTSSPTTILIDSTTSGLNDTTKVVTGLTNGTTYYFRVTAMDSARLESNFSNEVNATPTSSPILSVNPAALSFGGVAVSTTSQEKTYSLSGANLSPATGNITVTAPTAFEVSLTSSSGFASSINVSYTSGALLSTTIYVRFKPISFIAYSGNITNTGGGAPAQSVSVSGTGIQQIIVPAIPTNLVASVISGSQIDLSWTDASNNEDGFRVERKSGAGGTYALIATLAANVQSYSNTGLTELTTYYYRVYTYNSAGNSGYSNEANATTPDVTPPAAPTAAQIAPSGWTNQNTFTISWTNPSDPSGIAKAWYLIDTIPTISSPGKAVVASPQTLQINISSAGVHQIYFYLEDGSGNKNLANIASVNLKYDNIPPLIQDDSLNIQTYNADNPQSIAINASAHDALSGIRSMQLQYHCAGTSWSTTTKLNYGSITGGSTSIPLSDLSTYSKEGIDYRIYAQDSAGNTTYSPTHSIAIRFNTQFGRTDPSGNPITQVSTSSLASGIPLEYAYRMFSVPLDLDDKTPKTILESKTGLGTYDQKQWRFYSLDTANDSLNEYPGISSQAIVTPGRAFLLILKSGAAIKTGSGSIIKAEDIAKNGLPLKSGYNFIGNPFNYDVPIDSLSIANGMSLTGRTWQYVGTGGTNGGWLLNPPKLLAWEGIVINLGNNGPTTLRFKVADRPQTSIKSNSPFTKMNVVNTNSNTLNEWKTIIRASRLDNGTVDEENIIGVSHEVSDNTNVLNCFEPPLVGDKNISVSFESQDGTLTHDIRSITDTGWIWNMKVLTTDKNADLQLDFTELHKQKGFLLDLNSKMVYKLADLSTLKINSGNGKRYFRIIVGSLAFAEIHSDGIELVPSNYVLYQNYPNPFNPSTTIRFSLPVNSSVKLMIYDLLGREIVSLLDREMIEGYQEVEWRASVSTGIYFYRLEAAALDDSGKRFVEVRKMVLMK